MSLSANKYMKQTMVSKTSNKETAKVMTLPLILNKLNEKQNLKPGNKKNPAKTKKTENNPANPANK